MCIRDRFEGDSASFSVVAEGNPSPTYQWQRDGSDIAGETSATFSIASTETVDAGSYTVVVSNTEGDVTSDAAALVVEPALVAPSIITQPAAVTVTEGEVANFTVVAEGNPSPTYQWQRDGSDIAGATSATFSIASTETVDAGSYTVCLLYTSPSPRDLSTSRMPSSA